MFLQVRAGCEVHPEPGGQEGGAIKLRSQLDAPFAAPISGWAARIWLPTSTVTATIHVGTGAHSFSAAGTRQVYNRVLSGSLTSSGTYNVVVVGAHVPGSPVTVPVSLSTSVHTTPLACAEAIISALNAVTALSLAGFEFEHDGAATNPKLTMRSLWARTSDVTLALTLPTALGLSGGAITSTAGVAGGIIERLGATTEDAIGNPIVSNSAANGIIVHNLAMSQNPIQGVGPSGTVIPLLVAGGFAVVYNSEEIMGVPIDFDTTSTSPVVFDVMILA